jgi:hypothetical protein
MAFLFLSFHPSTNTCTGREKLFLWGANTFVLILKLSIGIDQSLQHETNSGAGVNILNISVVLQRYAE